MKNYFLIDSNDKAVRVVNLDMDNIKDSPPKGIYTVRYSDTGFYLHEKSALFDISTPLGEAEKDAETILAPYKRLKESTGALLTGIKGAGKSYLAKLVCNKAVEELGLPVVCVEDPFIGVDFSVFIDSLGDCVLFFDEFAKTYGHGNRHESPCQSDLLSLLDGVSNCSRVVILTENNIGDIDRHIIGRPSRVRYCFQFNRLQGKVVADYLNYQNIEDECKDEILRISNSYFGFNFDALKTLVSEAGLGYDNLKKVLKVLNIGETIRKKFKVVRVIERSSRVVYTATSETFIFMVGSGSNSSYFIEFNVKPKEIKTAKKDRLVAIYPDSDFIEELSNGDLVFENKDWKVTLREEEIIAPSRRESPHRNNIFSIEE